MYNQLKWAVLCSFLLVGLTVGMGVDEEGNTAHVPNQINHKHAHAVQGLTTTTSSAISDPSFHHHTLKKRFIWTLTQEPYFYGKGVQEGPRGLRGGEGVGMGGSETLPLALPLRRDAPLHKRLYPRWYQAYMYKTPSINRVANPVVGEHKRFQPFHPLARFRGLSMGGSSSSGGYRGSYDLPFVVDANEHRLPTAPNAQPSSPMLDEQEEEEEEEEAAEEGLRLYGEDEDRVKAGDLLMMLKNIARGRGLAGHTKGFRFGISRRK